MMLSLDTAYRSFGGEVEASSTPTICRLPDSRRHQLSAIAHLADQAFTVGAAQLDAAAGIGRLTSIATTGKSGKSGSGISWRLQPLRSQLRWKPRTLALRRRLG